MCPTVAPSSRTVAPAASNTTVIPPTDTTAISARAETRSIGVGVRDAERGTRRPTCGDQQEQCRPHASSAFTTSPSRRYRRGSIENAASSVASKIGRR